MRALLLAGVVAICSFGTAKATYTVTITQVGGDVVAAGSGSIDLAALTFVRNLFGGPPALIVSSQTDLVLGSVATYRYQLTGNQTLQPIGSSTVQVLASSETGMGIGLFFNPTNSFALDLPSYYVSETQIYSSATFGGSTFASLGLDPGTYTYLTGAGADTDSIVIQVGPATAVTEPATLALLALPMGAAGLIVALRRRKDGGGRAEEVQLTGGSWDVTLPG